MNAWENIGVYLGRTIRIRYLTVLESLADVDTAPSFKKTEMMLYFSRGYEGSPADKKLVQAAMELKPLALVLAGAGASRAFDTAMAVLCDSERRSHDLVMTSFVQEETPSVIAESLLYGTWPAEDRFDGWSNYSILIVGEAGEQGSVLVQAFRVAASSQKQNKHVRD
jgi:hypothetical protein